MLLASIRLGFLLTTLVASLHVTAAPRYWTLTGVRFDGTPASGYFSYDDATQAISNWNVTVDTLPSQYPAFTYVPGNSVSTVQDASAVARTLVVSVLTSAGGVVRQLQITPVARLDGSNATVALATVASRENLPEATVTTLRIRPLTAGSLTLAEAEPPVVFAQVDEFYHAGLRHYFITADAAEKQALDAAVHPGWQRTGESFKVYAKDSNTGGSVKPVPVCRFYGPPIVEVDYGYFEPGPDSHFFSADAGECVTVFRNYWYVWGLENGNAFQTNLPDKTTGACPGGTIPVYRLWNQRVDSNHRYTTSTAIRTQDLAAGYLAEGYGPNGVVMCAVQ